MKKVLAILLASLMVLSFAACGTSNGTSAVGDSKDTSATQDKETGKDLTFVIVPKCVHEWFDAVTYGAKKEAEALSKQLGVKVKIDYRAPATAEITAQNAVLEQAAATNPDGIAIDPLDYEGSKQIIKEIQEKGIPVVLFDSRVPGSGLCAVGNDFAEQATLEAEHLVKLLNGKGKVAIMHGVTTAPNHCERYETFKKVLAKYPDIQIIDGGASQDNYQVAQQQAMAVMAAHPDLAGWLCVDAAAPIGISAAIKEAGKVGKVTFVGAENLLQILEYIKDGTMVCSYSTKPQMQGALSVLMLFQAHMGMDLPKFVDTGILYIDQNNVDEWIEIVSAGSSESAGTSE